MPIPFEQALEEHKALNIELPQQMQEIQALYELVAEHDPLNFLEIGSRYGGSLSLLARALRPGSRIVVVDMEAGPWGRTNSRPTLERVAQWLREKGYPVLVVLADSQTVSTAMVVRELLPAPDFCFIDADHNYDGVKWDWEHYGQYARMAAFHDIAVDESPGPTPRPMGVRRLWKEIIPGLDHVDLSVPDSKFGIGVVWPKGRPEG